MAAMEDPAHAEPFPGVRRLRAPNPGPMTGRGTNSYLVGSDDLAVIDPGPEIPEHLARLLELGDGRIRYVLVTHAHRDHAPGAAWLAREARATLLGFGDRPGFTPTGTLVDGDVVRLAGLRLVAVHTPGHASDHLCYLLDAPAIERGPVLFSGDHVMGGSTVVINPPDGDMAAYFMSLERLAALSPSIGAIAPGHGEVIDDPAAKFAEYLTHRREREAQVRALLERGPTSPGRLVDAIYPDLDAALRPAAARQIWSHLRKLATDGVAATADIDDPEATWELSARR